MKNISARKVLLIILRIVKDIMRLSVGCLSVTILVSVCAENGWAIAKDPTIITHDMFWKMYDSIYLVCVPLILFGYGITGRYKVKDETCISVVPDSASHTTSITIIRSIFCVLMIAFFYCFCNRIWKIC